MLILFRKNLEEEFSVPFQAVYEHLAPESVLQRYRYVVDGQAISGRRGLILSIEETLLRYYAMKETGSTHADQFFLKKLSGRRLFLELWTRVLNRLSMVFRGKPS